MKSYLLLAISLFSVMKLMAWEPAPLDQIEKEYGRAKDGAYQNFNITQGSFKSYNTERYWKDRGGILATFSVSVIDDNNTTYELRIAQLNRTSNNFPLYYVRIDAESDGRQGQHTFILNHAEYPELHSLSLSQQQIEDLKQVIPKFKEWENKVKKPGNINPFVRLIGKEYSFRWDGTNGALLPAIASTIDINSCLKLNPEVYSHEVDDLEYIISQLNDMNQSCQLYYKKLAKEKAENMNRIDNLLSSTPPKAEDESSLRTTPSTSSPNLSDKLAANLEDSDTSHEGTGTEGQILNLINTISKPLELKDPYPLYQKLIKLEHDLGYHTIPPYSKDNTYCYEMYKNRKDSLNKTYSKIKGLLSDNEKKLLKNAEYKYIKAAYNISNQYENNFIGTMYATDVRLLELKDLLLKKQSNTSEQLNFESSIH